MIGKELKPKSVYERIQYVKARRTGIVEIERPTEALIRLAIQKHGIEKHELPYCNQRIAQLLHHEEIKNKMKKYKKQE